MSKDKHEKSGAGLDLSRFLLGGVVILLGVLVGLGYFLFVPGNESVQATEPVAEASVPEPAPVVEESLAKVVVYKSPTCGCCSKWIDHLRESGFEVDSHDLNDMSRIKAELGISRPLQSCHTALVDGYAIEGHVPADDIKRLLKERPAVAGLTVPAMPVGSPGMEAHFIEPYDVLSFDKQGNTEIFTEYRIDGDEYLKTHN